MNQLVFFPAWGHDDFPDVIQKAISYMAPLASIGKDLFFESGKRELLELTY